ncbi:MAG: hypothetical protein ACUVXI_00775 [bacterium]
MDRICRGIRRWGAILSIFGLWWEAVFASEFDYEVYTPQDVNPGLRAQSMGGAFLGVADDGSALLWNPSGLVLLQYPEGTLGFSHIWDYTWQNPSNNWKPYLGFANGYGGTGWGFNVGVPFLHFINLKVGQEDHPVKQSYRVGSIAGGGAMDVVNGFLSIGATGRLYAGWATLREPDGSAFKGHPDKYALGVGGDFGTLIRPLPQLRIGGVVRAPSVLWWNRYWSATSALAGVTTLSPLSFGAGVGSRITPYATLALDIIYDWWLGYARQGGVEFHGGGEYTFLKNLMQNYDMLVRAGIYTSPIKYVRFHPSWYHYKWHWTSGLGLAQIATGTNVDLGLDWGVFPEEEQTFGLGFGITQKF